MEKYEQLWNELKEKLKEKEVEYKEGYMMTLAESKWGEATIRDVLRLMNRMEDKK